VLSELPVQYNAPLFRRLSQEPDIDLTVLYSSALGTPDSGLSFPNFGREVVWDIDVVTGYTSVVMENPLCRADPFRRWTMLNPEVVRRVNRHACDVLVSYGWAFPVNWLAMIRSYLDGVPILLYTDTDVRDEGLTRHTRLRHAILSGLCRRSAGALYTGTFNRDFYIRHGMGPERLWFSPWAVENARFAVDGDGASSRRALGLRQDICYFLFVGALESRKRPLLALRAVRELQNRGRSVGMIFAGSGMLEREIQETIADLELRDIHMLGFVNQAKLPQVYAAGDIFLLPSFRDARATVVNEAMAAGLPAIISSGTGVWGPGDLVRHGKEGLVVSRDRPDELVRACDALTDARLRTRMGSSARARVQAWNYQTAVDGWRRALADIGVLPAQDRRVSDV